MANKNKPLSFVGQPVKQDKTEQPEKPVIGIYDDAVMDNDKLERRRGVQLMCWYIEKNGGIPALIPSGTDKEPAIMDNLDGVLFPGGSDIDPAYYRSDKSNKTEIDAEHEAPRFKTEEAMMRRCIKDKVPVVAICRGMQMVNVVMGKVWGEENGFDKLGTRGTLEQHLPDAYEALSNHQDEAAHHLDPVEVVRWQTKMDEGKTDAKHPMQPSHDLVVREGSRFAKLSGLELGGETGSFSFHHQAVTRERLAPGLKAVAVPKGELAGDKHIVEAAENDHVLIIQGHIESGVGNQAKPVFGGLVKDAQEWRAKNPKTKPFDKELMGEFIKTARTISKQLDAAAKAKDKQGAKLAPIMMAHLSAGRI